MLKNHKFINASITIIIEDKGMNDAFVTVDVVAVYAWNSSLSNLTNIFRSVPAIG